MTEPSIEIPPINGTDVTYLKARRKDLTIFVECSENDTIEMLKAKLSRFFNNGDIKLYHKGMMLDETTSLYHQNVRNGAEIFVITKANSYDGTWETLDDVGGGKDK